MRKDEIDMPFLLICSFDAPHPNKTYKIEKYCITYRASTTTNKNKLRGLSPQANYIDRATAAVGEVVPTFAGRGCYVVSTTVSHGR
jgi:hypothetical protein